MGISKIEIDSLLAWADNRTYSRGKSYYRDGAVEDLSLSGRAVSAKVLGTRSYRVSVIVNGDESDYECSCPVGMRGDFCKHVVAVLFACSDELEGVANESLELAKESLSKSLESLSKNEIIKIIESLCSKDRKIKKLFQDQIKKGELLETLDLKVTKKFLKKQFSSRSFVDYYAAPAFSEKMHEGLDILDEALRLGEAKDCLDLCEYAMELC